MFNAVSGAGFGFVGGIVGTEMDLLPFYMYDSCLPAELRKVNEKNG